MNVRLSGHTLRYEGAPFHWQVPYGWRRLNERGTAGRGVGMCSCGAHSSTLDSGQQRKAWHRDHKEALRG